jgi:hypothetical protein
VHVRWSDGTESEHNGITGQLTRRYVFVRFYDLPSMWALAGDVRRREVTCYLTTRTLGVECGPPVPARTPTGAKARAVGRSTHWVRREPSFRLESGPIWRA